MTAWERTGWRDQQISQRHRTWGFNCPAVDLDFLMVEYNLGLPVALVEYKHCGAVRPNLLHPTYRALRTMADLADLPFMIVFYWPDIWAFQVEPVNERARQHYEDGEELSERGYVERLYRMRKLTLEDAIWSKLRDDLPPSKRHPPAGSGRPEPDVAPFGQW